MVPCHLGMCSVFSPSGLLWKWDLRTHRWVTAPPLSLPPHRYWIFRSWGRVGTVIGSNKLEKMPSKEDAVEHFMKLYEEKTGNAWHSENFTKYPKKFYPLEIDYGQVTPGPLTPPSVLKGGLPTLLTTFQDQLASLVSANSCLKN